MKEKEAVHEAMTFCLDNEECKQLKEWQEAIKKVFGEYGNYHYIFKPFGIGMGIEVYSTLANKTLDLTDVSKW